MQRFKGVASGKQLFREHCATKWFLEANPRNITALKISRYTVYDRFNNQIKVDLNKKFIVAGRAIAIM